MNNEKTASDLEKAGNTPLRQSKEIMEYLYTVMDMTTEYICRYANVDDDKLSSIIDGNDSLVVSQFDALCGELGTASSVLMWKALMHTAEQEENQQKIQILGIIETKLRAKYPDDKMWDTPHKDQNASKEKS